jgi:hypothetical protein
VLGEVLVDLLVGLLQPDPRRRFRRSIRIACVVILILVFIALIAILILVS